MSRVLAIMGSGETAPTMVETHKRLLGAAGPDARLVDTPYGFQENADELTAKAVEYFDHRTGHRVAPVELRDTTSLSPAQLEDRVAACRDADWLFAGPGSPTYALRQWQQTRFPDVVADRLTRDGTTTVFASAAACVVGRHTVPVYEIYKVGQDPHWAPGLDLLSAHGLTCVVIPHFDNREGGGHDTRFCYLGARRLAAMEQELDDATWVLGIDEHTALVLDLDSGDARIEGRGQVTVRRRDAQVVFRAGDDVSVDVLRRAATGTTATSVSAPTASSTGGADVPAEATPLAEGIVDHGSRFDAALAAGDAVRAADVLLALERLVTEWASDPNQSDDVARADALHRRMVVDLARAAATGLGDPADRVRPFVETLLALRSDARNADDWSTADHIRDALADAGVELRDGPDGTTWSLG